MPISSFMWIYCGISILKGLWLGLGLYLTLSFKGGMQTSGKYYFFSDVNAIDQLAWKATPSGKFTVKIVYELLITGPSSSTSQVWAVPVARRVRCFIWLLLHGKLMINRERWRRGFIQDMSYSICGAAEEDMLHIFQDCPQALEFWTRIWRPNSLRPFLSLDIADWLSRLFALECILYHGSSSIQVLFLGLWWLWRWQNDNIFRNVTTSLN